MTPSLPARVLTAVVRGYQKVLSPLLGPRCRFYPSCSAYAVDALRERGAALGSVLAAYRVLRCNPWARGGVDVPPRRGQRWPSWDGVVPPEHGPGSVTDRSEAEAGVVSPAIGPHSRH